VVLAAVPPLNGGPYGPPVRWPCPANRTARLSSSSPSGGELLAGTWTFQGDPLPLGWPPRWPTEYRSELWAYNLHYFDWAWVLEPADAARSTVRDLLQSWVEAYPVGSSPAWDPYPTSLRAWNLCGLDQALGLCDPWFRDLLATHTRVIRATLERDLGGNHLLADLKALVGLAVWFGDSALLTKAVTQLAREAGRQVLADGGHEERSPAYHARVLADLLDVIELLNSAELPVPSTIDRAASSLNAWLEVMTTPLGTLPHFNDGDAIPPSALANLRAGSDRRLPAGQGVGCTHLAASGFVVARPRKDVYLAIDSGEPGPSHQPGHSHAGVGSFELWVQGEQVLRNVGTSTYAPGPRRAFERSTAAHNTVTLDDQNQSDVWKSFRVGRSARVDTVVEVTPHGHRVEIVHDGFRTPTGTALHRRTFEINRRGLEIRDELLASNSTGDVATRYYTAPGLPVTPRGKGCRLGPVTLSFDDAPAAAELSVDRALLATGFGQTAEARCAALRFRASLPVAWQTRIEW